MKLATQKSGTRDGTLVVVSRDHSRFAAATDIAPSLQAALDDWARCEPLLRKLQDDVDAGRVGSALDVRTLHAPLPRAYEWVDGSAYLNHVRLVRKARGVEPPATLETDPLVYQGGSGVLLAPTDDIPFVDDKWGLDFEAEVAVVLGDVPRGTTAADAAQHVRLLLLVNDVTLRGITPAELAKGFGFFQSKPASAFSPLAITPDELGDAWRGGRVHLRLQTTHNGVVVGDVDAGPEMHFSFFDLIAHISQTRGFTAGTIVGSGTVSNADRARGISCLVEARTIETLDHGAPRTPYLKPGDTVRIEMKDAQGRDLFGAIDQKVVQA